MNARIPLFAAALAASVALAAPFVAPAYAEMTKMVGGAPMYPSKNIIENAVNSKDHTTLVAAVKAAGLVDTLEGAGPFTVFAPTNEAFARLPAGTVETLLQAGEQGQADFDPDLPRRARPPDGSRDRRDDPRRRRQGDAEDRRGRRAHL